MSTPTPEGDRPRQPDVVQSQQPEPPALTLVGVVRKLGPVGILAVIWTAGPPLCSIPLFAYMPTISAWLRSHDAGGVAIFTGVFALLAGVGLLPTYAQSALGGFAFGWQIGIPGALGGFAGASVIGYWIARAASGERVMLLIDGNPRARAVRDALVRDKQAGGTWLSTMCMVALFRLPPNSPFALSNLAMAAARVPFGPFVVGTVLGMAPRTGVAVVIGSLVDGALTGEALDNAAPRWVWGVGIGVSLLIFLFIGNLGKRAVERVTRQEGGVGGGD